ncbi:MAG: hypothetical protein WCF90_11230 [Methanomicrobiales archaeon]
MWQPLWPEHKKENIPIHHITNGVHAPKWLDPKMSHIINKYFSPPCPDWMTNHDSPLIWDIISEIPYEELWIILTILKRKLVNRMREFKRRKWSGERTDPISAITVGALLDPHALTIGCTRRFYTYKRSDLIIVDLERIKRIVKNRWMPVRLIQKIYSYAHLQ